MTRTAGILLACAAMLPFMADASERVGCHDPIEIKVSPSSRYEFKSGEYSLEQLSSVVRERNEGRCVRIVGDPTMPDAWARQAALTGALRAAGVEGEIDWPEYSSWLGLLRDCRKNPSITACSKISVSEFSPYTVEEYIAVSSKQSAAETCVLLDPAVDEGNVAELDPVERLAISGDAQGFFSELASLPGYIELEKSIAPPRVTVLIDRV
jgi:hypothetical protein